MRSIAPWRHTTLSQVMSPSSSTTSTTQRLLQRSSPLFIQERQEPANLRQAYHSHEESLLPAQSFFARTSTVRPVHEPSSSQERKSGRDMENERIRILLERQKSKFSLKSELRSRSTNFKPILIEEVSRN